MIESLLIAVGVINILTFLAFGLDKRKAIRGARRTPEAVLIGLSFATGLVGGWLAMIVFRHKTKKLSFQMRMVLVSVFNLAWPLAWLWWSGHLD